jgi:hypothetical protein
MPGAVVRALTEIAIDARRPFSASKADLQAKASCPKSAGPANEAMRSSLCLLCFRKQGFLAQTALFVLWKAFGHRLCWAPWYSTASMSEINELTEMGVIRTRQTDKVLGIYGEIVDLGSGPQERTYATMKAVILDVLASLLYRLKAMRAERSRCLCCSPQNGWAQAPKT